MRIAILSDIHGNYEALKCVLDHMAEQDVRQAFCLGDSIGYGPKPDEVCKALMERSIPSVMGNHEWALEKKSRRTWFNPHAKKALTLTEQLLSPESIAWVRSLPLYLIFHDARLVHGMPPDSVRTYLFEMDNDELADMFEDQHERLFFVGHTHELEIVAWDGRRIDRRRFPQGTVKLDPNMRYLLNIGSVGQPRDGDNRAKYVVWDLENDTIDLNFVSYDIAATADEILRLGFPEQYAQRLW